MIAADAPGARAAPRVRCLGCVTAIDVARADVTARGEFVRAWVDGAWRAWADHHDTVRGRATDLLRRLD